jgi:hypothetical protein
VVCGTRVRTTFQLFLATFRMSALRQLTPAE